MHKVLLTGSAEKELNRLSKQVQKRIARALDDIVLRGISAPHTKKLNPPIGGYRTRVGEYRILFDREDEIIIVYRISKRASAY